MLALLLGGFFMSDRIKREVFPSFELDRVSISIAYPGASPEEVEKGIILAVEESLRGLDGIKEVNSTASEGSGFVEAELREGADSGRLFQDIQQQINRISTFPEDAEDPVIKLAILKRRVLRVNLYGDVGERTLREVTEQVRDRLLQQSGIDDIDIVGGSDFEVEVAIPKDILRTYNLTLAEVAGKIRQLSAEIPGGSLETSGGDLLLRVSDRKLQAEEFAQLPIVTPPDGSIVRLGDIAEVRETFADASRIATFNRKPCLQLYIYRIGRQTPISVATTTREAMADIEADIPPGIHWAISGDRSVLYKQRLELLLKNAAIGLTLVLVLLGIFLELRLAFWVTMGIPVSFLGALLFLPFFDVSINMISMFAFIIALGIVVDDAIIAGENIYEHRQRGMDFVPAAIQGAKEVAVPITFSILTNIIAFLPMAFVPGVMGKVWRVIPLVVITVFVISWVESLLILPAHLAHSKRGGENLLVRTVHRIQQKFSNMLQSFVEGFYGPILSRSLKFRYLLVAILSGILIITVAYVKSGRIRMILSPRVEADRAVVTATLPLGSPLSETIKVRDKLLDGLDQVAAKNGGKELLESSYSRITDNVVQINGYLQPPDIRPLATGEVTRRWRKATGPIPGVQSVKFEADRGGPGSGASISVELSHRDIGVLDRASSQLADQLEGLSFVTDIDDGYTPGKKQFSLKLNSWGTSLGLTTREIGQQLRNGFQGSIALRQQRGNNELTVRVRLPERERNLEYSLENMLISTPDGTFVPLLEVAALERGRAYTKISRRDGRRTVTVSANVDPIGESPVILETLNKRLLPELKNDFPGLQYGYRGRQADRKESVANLGAGFLFALGGIYFLLAIPFRSYSQPFIVMITIPFGMVGAVIGHLIMDYHLSLMSMMGIVALAGVVVNDSLVLVDYANRRILEGVTSREAILAAGLRRFRPVLLTTLTTFGGLAPMIFETSRQARFMIPMAISLGFGIVFATVITLGLIPCLYLIIDDIHQLFGRENVTTPVSQSEK